MSGGIVTVLIGGSYLSVLIIAQFEQLSALVVLPLATELTIVSFAFDAACYGAARSEWLIRRRQISERSYGRIQRSNYMLRLTAASIQQDKAKEYERSTHTVCFYA